MQHIPTELTLLQLQAMGRDVSALCEWRQGDRVFLLHKEAVEPLQRLQADARAAGFDLQLASAHRDFERQLVIWNAKAEGRRQLLDSDGQPLDFASLSAEQKLFAIMRWSAVPGLSRHHWGTDIDIFDASQIALDDVQLVPAEVEGDGPCSAMHRWLTGQIASNCSHGFYRPYQFDNGGIAPELWHISYFPLANTYARQLRPGLLEPVWQESHMALHQELVANLTSIWPTYVQLDANRQPEWVKNGLGWQSGVAG